MSNTADNLLTALDTEQRQVAQQLLGPVAVLAGAGSGKTRTITHRIAYGVQTGTFDPAQTLALTYTRKAAFEMSERLTQLGAGEVKVRTIHSEAMSQFNEFWPLVVGGQRPEIIAQPLAVIQQAADAAAIALNEAQLQSVADEIVWRKVSLLSVDEYAKIAPQRREPTAGVSAEDLIEIMTAYEELKTERRAIDFEDLLALVAGMIASEPLVFDAIRRRYRFITVDEFQDISPLQFALLQQWLTDHENLCVVGDVSQTIFGFAGASGDFLLDFKKHFPQAKVFKLEANYRSSASIIAAANTLVRDLAGALQLVPVQTYAEVPVAAAAFLQEASELEAVAAAIWQDIQNGTPASQIAVLARTNAQLQPMRQALHRLSIACRMGEEPDFFSRVEISKAILELQAHALNDPKKPIFQAVADVFKAQGFTDTLPASMADREVWENLQALRSLIEELDAQSLPEVAQSLLAMKQKQITPRLNAVSLMSMHSAKGLEWDVVYVIGAAEGKIPLQRASSEESVAEEKRLMYVALTRARKILRLSLSAGAGNEVTPSRFLQESRIPVIASR